MKYYSEDLQQQQQGGEDKREKGKAVVLAALDGFSTAVNIVSTRYNKQMYDFLTAIGE